MVSLVYAVSNNIERDFMRTQFIEIVLNASQSFGKVFFVSRGKRLTLKKGEQRDVTRESFSSMDNYTSSMNRTRVLIGRAKLHTPKLS